MKAVSSVIGFLLIMVTLTSSGCMYLNGVDGNGKVVTENRDVSSFHAIKVGGAFNIVLTQGSVQSVTIEADENLLPIIETDVRGGTLVISTKENIRDSKALNLYITFDKLDELNFSGACDVSNKGTLKFADLEMKASGASEIELNLEADVLNCDYSGASEIDFTGKAGSCDIELSGASELDAYDFVVADMELSISGAGDAKVHATDKLKVSASGAASVRYMGNPSVDQRVSGAGSVRKK